MDDTDIETNDTNHANTAEKAVDSQAEWSAPAKRDPVTGRFIAGTGGSLKGGRPKGSKDRVSKAMVDLATELVANRGAELFEAMADRDPAQALALVAKIVPPEEMRAVFHEERTGEKTGQPVQVTIGVVPSPERLPDSRTQQDVDDRQRGLTQRIERASEPVERVVSDVPQEAGRSEPEADKRAQEEADRVRRQNDAIRAHGGLTGRAPRGSAPDTLEYRDDGDWL